MTTFAPTAPPTFSGPLPHDDSNAFFVALFVVLVFARGLAELAGRLKQPFIIGELITGILLGKTVLNRIWPAAFAYMFGTGHKSSTAFAGVAQFSATMFMLVAGLELDLNKIKKLFGTSFAVGITCIAIPFAIGFGTAYAQPVALGLPPGGNPTGYALFVGVALSITALPVAAKTLRDIGLYQSELGTIVMSAAAIDDVLGWCVFAVVLVLNSTGYVDNGLGLAGGVVLSIAYVVLVVSVGSIAVNKALPAIQAYFSWPGSTLGFIVSLALGSASFALWVGLHNTLAAFIVGVAVGNSPRFRASTREILDQVVTFVMAPLFFGSVCISVDMVASWNSVTVFSIFFLGCLGKLAGGYIGARIGRSDHVQACAIAVCMNSRGAMELILAGVANDVHVIDGQCFVALVFLAIVTSLVPGPMLRFILKRKEQVSFLKYIKSMTNVDNAPHVMSRRDAAVLMLDAAKCNRYLDSVAQAFDADPHFFPSSRFAVPRVRLPGLHVPVVLFFVSLGGVAMHPESGTPAQIIVLLMLPEGASPVLEKDVVNEIETLLESFPTLRSELFEVTTRLEVVSLVRIYKHQKGLESWTRDQELLRVQEREARRQSLMTDLNEPPSIVTRMQRLMSFERKEPSITTGGPSDEASAVSMDDVQQRQPTARGTPSGSVAPHVAGNSPVTAAAASPVLPRINEEEPYKLDIV